MISAVIADKPVESFYAAVWRRFKQHRLALFSLFVLTFLSCLSLLAPWIEMALGVSHSAAQLYEINLPPSWPHILGTNEIGQDVFARLIFGGRISLSVGFIAALTSALIGTFIGLLAGFYGGKIDATLMRFTDAMLSVPVLPLMIVFAALDLNRLFSSASMTHFLVLLSVIVVLYMSMRFFLDARQKRERRAYFFRIFIDSLIVALTLCATYWLFFRLVPWPSLAEGNFASVIKLIAIIVFFGWMTVARLTRASTMQLKTTDFVLAAKALGASNRRIILVHILPNALAPIMVAATLEVGGNILYEAALSFLGLGIQPPVSSWGNMLSNAVDYIKITPGLAFWPGLFILITVACFNFLGDGMRDALDPHQVIKRVS